MTISSSDSEMSNDTVNTTPENGPSKPTVVENSRDNNNIVPGRRDAPLGTWRKELGMGEQDTLDYINDMNENGQDRRYLNLFPESLDAIKSNDFDTEEAEDDRDPVKLTGKGE